MPLQTPSSSKTIFLDQPPSCLQFCPASPNNFVVGTYLLSETKDSETDTIQQTKTGSLQLWNLNPENDELTKTTIYPIPAAVFDLHFHPRNPNILGIATSAGAVSLFSVSEDKFTHLWTRNVHEDPSIPALFLAWMPETWISGLEGQGNRDGFAVTFSDGRTGVFGIDADSLTSNHEKSGDEDDDGEDLIKELGTFNAKDPIEVWYVAVASYPDYSPGTASEHKAENYTPYLFTGNDFGTLHTRRFPDFQSKHSSQPGDLSFEDEEEILAPILSIDDKSRHHSAGVTSILPLPIPLSLSGGAPLLLTGSYDESLRVYHAQGRGSVLGELGLGGGVWRLQILRASIGTFSAGGEEKSGEGEGIWTFLVLASCMHGGTRVVRVTITIAEGEGEPGVEIEVLAEFREHESMNYASDVWRPEGNGSELRIVSSSFYDRRVCVWRVQV
ncbi:hypothetical protein BJX99DRAFT_217079 [Aspergillus californicus]